MGGPLTLDTRPVTMETHLMGEYASLERLTNPAPPRSRSLGGALGLAQIGAMCALLGCVSMVPHPVARDVLPWLSAPEDKCADEAMFDITLTAVGGLVASLPAVYWQRQRWTGQDCSKARLMSIAASLVTVANLAYALSSHIIACSSSSMGEGWRLALMAAAAHTVAVVVHLMEGPSPPYGSSQLSSDLPKFAQDRILPHRRTLSMSAEQSTQEAVDRRQFTHGVMAGAFLAANTMPGRASAEVEVPPQILEFEFPDDWKVTGKYDVDARKVVAHMKLGTTLGKGANRMSEFHTLLKKEMVDFVSEYRRFDTVTGKQSFSTLYTAINGYCSHLTSYGMKYPIPEKRRKRLYQEYADIERQLKKGR